MKQLLKTVALLLGFAALPTFAPAQTAVTYSVKGHAVDDAGEDEPFATYRIYAMPDTAKVIVVNTADSAGMFSHSLSRPGSYRLVLNSVGRRPVAKEFELSAGKPSADLGNMALLSTDAMLKEVSVTAQRPLVTKEIDRVGYDVQADEDSKTNTVLEMLRKVPMVSVDADGTIKVNGSSNFRIFKDGRPNQAFTNNGKDIFTAIPASMIKRIEVITEPGAKYDAEGVGAILNIVTMENTAVNGITGNVGIRAESENDFIPGANLWLSGQVKKFAFSVYGGEGYRGYRAGRSKSYSESEYQESGNVYRSTSESRSKHTVGWVGAEASYELDTMNLFSLEMNGFGFNMKSHGTGTAAMTSAAGTPLYSYTSATRTPMSKMLQFDGTINYQHSTRREGEELTLSYALSLNNNDSENETEYGDMVNFPLPYDSDYNKSKQHLNEHTFQADWTRPFGEKHTLDVGAKYILRRNNADNTRIYGEEEPYVNDFKHNTDVGALYSQYTFKTGPWSLRAGLRYEYSRMEAKFGDPGRKNFASELNDLVPSAAISWMASMSSTLTFNYAARINRPDISYLDPVPTVTPTTISYGNPNLESARHNSFKLTYMLIKPKFNFNISAQYELSNDGIVSDEFVDEDGMINSTYINAGHHRSFNINTFMQWSITDKTQLMLNGTVTNERYSQNGMSLSRWGSRAFARLQQNLPWDIQGSVMCFSMVGSSLHSVYSYGKLPGSQAAFLMIEFSKSFLKEKRLNVSVGLHNILGPTKRGYDSYTVNGDVLGHSRSANFSRASVALRVSYRFGSFNARVRKANKTIENDDLMSAPSSGSSSGGSSESQM